MKTLAFDTSTRFLSIALLEGDRTAAEFHEDVGIRHSDMLVPVIKDMLGEVNWTVRDIGLICTGIGPGSFTGLRIAVSTVKGLAAVLRSKVIGVPSMDAMVMNPFPEQKRIAPLLDARKGKVYACIYENTDGTPQRVTGYLLSTIDDLLDSLDQNVVFFGDAVVKYRKQLDGHCFARYMDEVDWYPRAVHIGHIGLERSISGAEDPASLDPLYLHEKECNITKRVQGPGSRV